MQTCAHCQKPIGQLEPVYAWNDRVICGDCQRTLEKTSPSAAPVHVIIDRPKVQLIERTAKFWKIQIALSMIVMLIGLYLSAIGIYRLIYPPISHGWLPIGAILLAVGVVWLFIARTGAWWEHG